MKCTMLMTTKLNLNFSNMLMSTFKKKLAAMAIMLANILQNYKLFLLKLSFCWLFVALINSLSIDHNFLFLVLHFSPRNEKLKKNENEKLSFSLQPIIAILDSLIGMILVNSHIWYLSWKNDSASMLDFVQQPKYVQNWGKWRKLPNVYLSYPIRYSKLSFVYSNPSLSNNWHLLPFSKNMSSNIKPSWGVEWVFPKWSVFVVIIISNSRLF